MRTTRWPSSSTAGPFTPSRGLYPPQRPQEVARTRTSTNSSRRDRRRAQTTTMPTSGRESAVGNRLRRAQNPRGYKVKTAGELYAERIVPAFVDRPGRILAPDVQERLSREYAEREQREQLNGVSIHGHL